CQFRFPPHLVLGDLFFAPPPAGAILGDPAAATAADEAGAPDETDEQAEDRPPVGTGVNGATAVGTRSRFEDRRKAGSSS
ncbi:undecaprenyl/decaprenyl-phosphate alpha-N-acetylglucosaminyl 1-phosphate transferase, partial [Streptomyces sp. NPDC088360]